MSQNKDDKSTASRPPADAGLPKRPVPTIDLKATEVKVETASASASSPASGPGTNSARTADPKADVKPASAAPSGKPEDVAKTATPQPATTAAMQSASSSGSSPASKSSATVPPISASSAKSGGGGSTTSSTKTGPDKGAADKTSAATSAATAVPPSASKSGGGIGRALTYLSAAVLGGILALFGADYLASSLGIDVRPANPAAPAIEDLSGRLKKLEQAAAQPAQLPAVGAVRGLTEQLTQTSDRLAKLESASQQIAALGEAQGKLAESTRSLEAKVSETAPAVEAAGKVAKLEEAMQGLVAMAQSQPGRPIPELARLTTKLTEVEQAVASLRKGGGNEAMAQIEARLVEARKAEAQMSEAVEQLKAESAKRLRELEGLKTQAERLESRVDAVRAEAGTARNNVDILKTDLMSQLQTVARQGDLKTSLEGFDKRVAGLETRLDAMSKRDAERQTNSERIVVSLQLANLKRVMDQGKPYGEALAEVEKVASGLIDLGPLKAYREKGVPSSAELITQFRAMARAVLEAEQDRGQTSTIDRLLQSAKSVVQIRRTGDIQGDTAEALLARTEQYLKTGDLVAAAKEVKALKPEARVGAQGWIDQLDARVAVDRAVKAIEDKLKTSIASAPAAAKGGKQ